MHGQTLVKQAYYYSSTGNSEGLIRTCPLFPHVGKDWKVSEQKPHFIYGNYPNE
jgi:hypothetical protein